MKKILFIILSVATIASSSAQQKSSPIRFGVHLGIDLGAAIPWPVSDAIGEGDKMSVVPNVSPGIGVWFGYRFDDRWSVNIEATYKTVGMDATIISLTKGQRFSQDGEKVLFRGKATTSMLFTMLEVPLYARFKINPNNAVVLGGYFSYLVSGKFEARAIQGTVVNASTPDALPSPVVEGDLPVQYFNSNLDTFDIGWTVGYERKISNRINASARFTMGLKDIFKPNENYLDYGMVHMRGTISVGYRIF